MNNCIKLAGILCFFLVFFQVPNDCSSAKILSVAFMSSKSHKITYETLLYELAKRGHEVTVLSPVVSGKKIKNLREIQTIDVDKFMDEMPNLFEMKERGEKLNPFTMLKEFGHICELTYDLPQTKKLLEEKFDMVIMPAIFNECAAGYVYKFNTTILIVSPVSAPSWITSILGTPSPSSFIPNLFSSFDQNMNFYERTVNFMLENILYLVQNYYFKPHMQKIYREKLNDPNIPSNDEILKNASLVISNSHYSISPIRPFMPDIVEVVGMHCRPAEPLPKDLEDFMNSSGDDGVILFSMGSALKGSTMPEKYRKIFLNTFSKLKQKVLWKWETEEMEGLPKNVKLSKWLPQQDVLGHPKLNLFITHGGFGSTTEAVYHGVPLVGLAMFGDQPKNMAENAKRGYAVSVDFNSLSEDLLYNSIQEVLGNPMYKERVMWYSKIFRDQPNNPLEKAVFWTEYVLRHKGAIHLRSPSRDLNGFQYHSLDVFAFIFGAIFIVLYISLKILCFVTRKIFGTKCCSSSKNSQKNGIQKKNN